MEMETNGTRGLAFNTLKLYKERIIGHPIRYKVLSVRYFINGMIGFCFFKLAQSIYKMVLHLLFC